MGRSSSIGYYLVGRSVVYDPAKGRMRSRCDSVMLTKREVITMIHRLIVMGIVVPLILFTGCGKTTTTPKSQEPSAASDSQQPAQKEMAQKKTKVQPPQYPVPAYPSPNIPPPYNAESGQMKVQPPQYSVPTYPSPNIPPSYSAGSGQMKVQPPQYPAPAYPSPSIPPSYDVGSGQMKVQPPQYPTPTYPSPTISPPSYGVRPKRWGSEIYYDVGSRHWISKNYDGKYIQLEDGSLWEISDFDVIDTRLWLSADDVIVVESDNPSYPYLLINTDDKTKAEAKLIKH
jgi:hypothetical protein